MELVLHGLDCPNCATKIEKEVKKLAGVENAIMDFAVSKLSVTLNPGYSQENVKKEIAKIVGFYEPEVVVLDKNTSNDGEISQREKQAGVSKLFSHVEKSKAVSFLLGIVLLAFAMFMPVPAAIRLSFYITAYLISGYDVLWNSVKNISRGHIFDENFLMSIATVGALCIGQYSEAVAVMLFYKAGEFFQDYAVNRSRKSIAGLMDIRPDFAHLERQDGIIKTSPYDVRPGDIIIVKPGEKIPLDGIVLEGQSALDVKALTGESLPRDVFQGSEVLSGCVNKTGLLRIKVTKEFGESSASKILNLVENASSKKAATENFITKFAGIYTPLVVSLALCVAFIPPFITGQPLSDWVYRALIFLVISCPCALVISIPLSFFGGIGGASRTGILVKGGNYLEALNNTDIVVFDKTGTLTKGIFSVTKICPKGHFNEDSLLEYAAQVESFSSHPIALSIVKHYGQFVDRNKVSSYSEIPGKGVSAMIDGVKVLAGTQHFVLGEENDLQDQAGWATIVHVSIDGEYAGFLVIADQIKEDGAKAISQLKSMGVNKTVMLTGDREAAAKKVAEEAGIDIWYAGLLPQDKVSKVEELLDNKPKGKTLVFVGDGINDAPVLSRADIGIAMGGLGSDAAIEAADIVLMTDEPSKIATAIEIAKKTRKIVVANIILAIVIKIAAMMLGLFGVATMWEAVFADVGVSLLAVLNAMRAIHIKR